MTYLTLLLTYFAWLWFHFLKFRNKKNPDKKFIRRRGIGLLPKEEGAI
jgi:hypothetical protein